MNAVPRLPAPVRPVRNRPAVPTELVYRPRFGWVRRPVLDNVTRVTLDNRA